jgi:hypothetical protein
LRSQLDVAGADDLESAVVQPQAERSVGLDAVEPARHGLVPARMDREPCSDGVCASEPRLCEEQRLALPPQLQQPLKAFGERGREFLRSDLARERRARPIGKLRHRSQIDSEADDHPIAAPLEQNAGEFLAEKKKIVRPFEHHCLTGQRAVDRLDQRETRRERQGRRLRIAGAKLDERASMEIPARRLPGPPLPALARFLFERDQPLALACCKIGNQVGIGRAGALDEADAVQKSVPAARSDSAVSGPMSR